MKVSLLFFAAAREAVGREADAIEVPPNASVQEVLQSLLQRHAALAPLRGSLRVAVNEAFVDEDHVLHDGDRLALLPPVSGG